MAWRIIVILALGSAFLTPVAGAAGPGAESMDPGASPIPEVLTLDGAVDLFLRRNLALEAARLQVSVAEAEIIGARLHPRPTMNVAAENLRVAGEVPFNQLYEAGATVLQPIELGNRITVRSEHAAFYQTAAKANLAAVLQRRLYELKRAFFEALLQRNLLDLAAYIRKDFEELVRFNTARFREGYISEGELLKARLELVKYDAAVRQAGLSRQQANIRLLEMLGERSFEKAPVLELRGVMPLSPEPFALPELQRSALVNRKDILAAESEAARAGASVRLERSRAHGEIVPFAGYKRVGPDDTVLAGILIPLPFGNRNQAGIARAQAEQRLAESNLLLARNRAMAEVESAYRAHEVAAQQVKWYEQEILRQADESLAITMAAYREGGVDIIALLDSQRTRSEVRANYYRAVFDFRSSILLLEQARGSDLGP